MDSVRSFVRIWAALTVVILAYAFIDLRMHPWLETEHHFTMTPDINQLPALLHWGGRLLKESAFSLLFSRCGAMCQACSAKAKAIPHEEICGRATPMKINRRSTR